VRLGWKGIAVIVAAGAAAALLLWAPTLRHSLFGGKRVTNTTSSTAVEFSPPIEWPFSVSAEDEDAAEGTLERFIARLKAELRARVIAMRDERDTRGSLVLEAAIDGDPRRLIVRLAVATGEPTIGAAGGESPAVWSGTLYADIASFERLSAGDRDAVHRRLDTLAAEIVQAAASAAQAVPGITPG